MHWRSASSLSRVSIMARPLSVTRAAVNGSMPGLVPLATSSEHRSSARRFRVCWARAESSITTSVEPNRETLTSETNGVPDGWFVPKLAEYASLRSSLMVFTAGLDFEAT